jgi:hypothetical protein
MSQPLAIDASTAPPESTKSSAPSATPSLSTGRSLLSSFAAGIATRSPRAAALSQQQQQHRSFLETQLLPVVYKLQKEVGWRKYKVSRGGKQ